MSFVQRKRPRAHVGLFGYSLGGYLAAVLSYLGARKLIITGFAADICVLFTANDAYMRDYKLIRAERLHRL